MAQKRTDEDQAWALFWERFEKQAPTTYAFQQHIVKLFEEAWSRVNPLVGAEHVLTFSVNKEGRLEAEMPACIFAGCIATVAAQVATERAGKASDKKLKKLDAKWQERLQGIEDRLKPIEEWCGITGRPEEG